MIVRRTNDYQVQMITERNTSRVAITLQGQRFEFPQHVAEDFAAAIEETIYDHTKG